LVSEAGVQRFILDQNLQRYRRRLAGEAEGPTRDLLRRLIAGCERDLAMLDADVWGALPTAALAAFGAGFAAGLEGALDRREIARALDACADPALLIDPGPGLHIIDLNQAFCDAAMVEAARAVGERLFAAFPENPDDPGSDGIVNLYASLRRAAATGKPHAMSEQRYDLRDAAGRFVERRWRMQNIPIFAKSGRLLYLLHQVEDVTLLAAAAARRHWSLGARPAAN
jgi:hypothetical protein